MRNLLSRMSWNSGVARAAVVGLADVAEVVALEGVEGFGGVVFQLWTGPDQAGPGQLCDGGDGVQFGHDAERVPEPVPAFIRKVSVGRDGVGAQLGEFAGDEAVTGFYFEAGQVLDDVSHCEIPDRCRSRRWWPLRRRCRRRTLGSRRTIRRCIPARDAVAFRWPGHSLAWTFVGLDIRWLDIRWPGHSLAWTFVGLDIRWPGRSLAWTFVGLCSVGLDVRWPGHSLAWTFVGLDIRTDIALISVGVIVRSQGRRLCLCWFGRRGRAVTSR